MYLQLESYSQGKISVLSQDTLSSSEKQNVITFSDNLEYQRREIGGSKVIKAFISEK